MSNENEIINEEPTLKTGNVTLHYDEGFFLAETGTPVVYEKEYLETEPEVFAEFVSRVYSLIENFTLPRFNPETKEWSEGWLHEVWFLNEDNSLKGLEIDIDPRTVTGKFTLDPFPGRMDAPVYQVPENLNVTEGLVTGGQWVDADPPERVKEIDQLKLRVNHKINLERNAKLKESCTILLKGENQEIQIRNSQDLININAQVTKALVLNAKGVTDEVIVFRTKDNVNLALTPVEMIELGTGVAEHVENIYKDTWELKEYIDSLKDTEKDKAILRTLVEENEY